jgi:hypothetical protein
MFRNSSPKTLALRAQSGAFFSRFTKNFLADPTISLYEYRVLRQHRTNCAPVFRGAFALFSVVFLDVRRQSGVLCAKESQNRLQNPQKSQTSAPLAYANKTKTPHRKRFPWDEAKLHGSTHIAARAASQGRLNAAQNGAVFAAHSAGGCEKNALCPRLQPRRGSLQKGLMFHASRVVDFNNISSLAPLPNRMRHEKIVRILVLIGQKAQKACCFPQVFGAAPKHNPKAPPLPLRFP